jgi:hypothetical protein
LFYNNCTVKKQKLVAEHAATWMYNALRSLLAASKGIDQAQNRLQ